MVGGTHRRLSISWEIVDMLRFLGRTSYHTPRVPRVSPLTGLSLDFLFQKILFLAHARAWLNRQRRGASLLPSYHTRPSFFFIFIFTVFRFVGGYPNLRIWRLHHTYHYLFTISLLVKGKGKGGKEPGFLGITLGHTWLVGLVVVLL